jgi:hypothetical protein
MPYGSDPAAAPATGGYGKDPIWQGLKTAAEKPAEPQTSAGAAAGQGLWEGLKSFYKGAEGLGVKMLTGIAGQGGEMVPRQEAEMQQQRQAFAQSPAMRQHPAWATGGNIVGEAAPAMAMPGGAGMGAAGRLGLGALQGAVAAGIPSGGNPMQTAIGAGGGAAMSGLGAAIGPRIPPAFQAIQQKFPNFLQMVTGRVPRNAEGFQRATANEVLTPIGQTVPPNVKIGHDLVNYVGDKIDDVYNAVLPKVTFRATDVDPYTGVSFTSEIPGLAKKVPQAHQEDFKRLIEREFTNRVDPAGNMPGDVYKKVYSEIGRLVRQNSKPTATGSEEGYAEVLNDLRASMQDTLKAHNPTEAPVLAKADAAWARYVRLQEAAGRGIAANGEFMPNDLLYASRKGSGNRAFSEGDLLMQKFGQAGNELISGKQPNASKYLAELLGGAVGGGIGGAAGHVVGGPVGGYVGAGAGAAAGAAMAHTVGAGGSRARQLPISRGAGAVLGGTAPVAGAEGREAYVSSVGP